MFGVPDAALGTERLVVVAESRETEAAARAHLRANIIERVIAGLGIPPDVVAIYGPGTVLKTPSGKIRRGATRDAYRGGQLGIRPSARRQWARLMVLDIAARLRRVPDAAGALADAGWIGLVLAIGVPLLWALVLLLPRGRAVDPCHAGLVAYRAGNRRLPSPGRRTRPAARAWLGAVRLQPLELPRRRRAACRDPHRIPVRGQARARKGTADRCGDPEGPPPHRRSRGSVRGVADAANITGVLRDGTSILFFPEGTFVRASGILPFRLGAFKAAVDARCPVIPVGLRGTRAILPAYRWLPRRGPITVTIGSPITPEKDDWREMVRVRDLARDEVARAAGELRVEERAG